MAQLQSLPLELLLQIINYLSPETSIDFALAHYPLLLFHHLVPALPLRTLRRLRLRRYASAAMPSIPGMPREMTLSTLRHLDLADRIPFVVALYLR